MINENWYSNRQYSRFCRNLTAPVELLLRRGSAGCAKCIAIAGSNENITAPTLVFHMLNISCVSARRARARAAQAAQAAQPTMLVHGREQESGTISPCTDLPITPPSAIFILFQAPNLSQKRRLCGYVSILVQLPNGVLGVKRVLGYRKRFIVDYVTWTCPEPKSAGCHLGTTTSSIQNAVSDMNDN